MVPITMVSEHLMIFIAFNLITPLGVRELLVPPFYGQATETQKF